jgi:pyruvate dehydrogenase E2 component (dihydrolipoamide acetyltransferase)
MAIAITIPRLGWNMEEGVFAGWLKRDGEPVRPGEPLFSLEGDKATQDVESVDPGILKIPPDSPGTGDKVLVGAVIGYLLQAGEVDVLSIVAGPGVLGDHIPFQGATGSPEPVPDRPRPARTGSGEPVAPSNRGRLPSTPLARRLARELGVDWTGLRGSGLGGRVRKVDVLEAARIEPRQSVPVSPARRTIAARMVHSRQTTAPVTLTTTVDVTNLVSLRRQFNDGGPPNRVVPGYTDFVVKLTALALHAHPLLNARWAEDRIELSEETNIGFAVDTDAGLFVPVIRDASALSLAQIAERARDLIRRARENRLLPGEMQGGTFTITNLGAFGVEAFTPIINPPECAILGMGRIVRQPVMDGDRVIGRDRMTLSLTFDHRIVDGAPAARFLQLLTQKIENPAPWLIG